MISDNFSYYLKTDSTNTRKALTWIHAQKHSLKLTFNQRTRGPNCFFLSVTNFVISFFPTIHFNKLYNNNINIANIELKNKKN